MSRGTRSLLIACTVAVVLVWITASEGAYRGGDGNQLLAECTAALRFIENEYRSDTSVQIYQSGLCMGFLDGVVGGYYAAFYYEPLVGGSRTSARLCHPAQGISHEQAVRIVVTDLRERPQSLHMRADSLVLTALFSAFPCAPTTAPPTPSTGR